LKRPRGMIDPGAFDFERYALEQGITATGSVREDASNTSTGADALCVDRLLSAISMRWTSTNGRSRVPRAFRT
jgi:competence protein ComEC